MASSEIEHADRADYLETAPIRSGDRRTIIHKDKLGSDSYGESDRSLLAFAQGRKRRVVADAGGILLNVKPFRRMRDPGLYCGRGFGMRQLVAYCSREDDPAKQLPQQVNRVDQHEVIERPGIRDNRQHMELIAEPLQVAPLTIEIVESVSLEDGMGLQKAVKGVSGTETQKSTQLGPG
jgi:hypothetical protein